MIRISDKDMKLQSVKEMKRETSLDPIRLSD